MIVRIAPLLVITLALAACDKGSDSAGEAESDADTDTDSDTDTDTDTDSDTDSDTDTDTDSDTDTDTDTDTDVDIDITLDLALADAKLVGENAGDEAGLGVSGAGDVDGDGHDDLLIGASSNDEGGTDAGAAYLVLGPVKGTLDIGLAYAKLVGEDAGDAAGMSVARAGDVDGDGNDDLLIGAHFNGEAGPAAGAAYLWLGPVLKGTVSLAEADAKLLGETASDIAGYAVSGAGDVDADGHDDLLIGAYGNDEGGSDAGAAYLVHGPITGTVDLSLAAARLVGEDDDGYAGYTVSGVGDMDADGNDDLLIGAPYNDEAAVDTGAAYLVVGPVEGSVDLGLALKLVSDTEDDRTGCSVAGSGDVDGDGHDDLLIGAYLTSGGAGVAYLVLGPVTGSLDLSLADAKLAGSGAEDGAGVSVSGAGDVDGDSHDDILVGAYRNSDGAKWAGAAYLVLGPVTGTVDLSSANARLLGEDSFDEAGSSVSGAGDVDDDGHADLLIGSSNNAEGGSQAGAAYLVYGGSL